MDPTLRHKKMGLLFNRAGNVCVEQKTETYNCRNWFVNIETGAKLRETLGTVSTWHDE